MAAGGEVGAQEARSVHDGWTFVLSTQAENGFRDKGGFTEMMLDTNKMNTSIFSHDGGQL